MRKVILQLLFVLLAFCGFSQEVTKYTTANINVRAGEGTKYAIVTTIPKGTPVTMTECDCDWIYVEYNGHRGWVSAKYLSYRQPQTTTPLSNNRYYTNSRGERVHSPAYSQKNKVPVGATALCRDGTYSFSRSRRGTCSHHGGVAKWL